MSANVFRPIHRWALLLMPLLCSALASAATADVATVTAIRVSESATQGTHVAIDLTAQRPVKLFTLRAPDRVVLDISAAYASDAAAGLAAAAHDRMLKGIRLGRQPGGVLRLVFDTNQVVTPQLSTIPANNGCGLQFVVTLDGGATAVVDSETSRAPTQQQPPRVAAPVTEAKLRIVAVDAGHGGADLGSLGRAGTREKDVTLVLAKAVAARIDALPGWRAVLTRSDDQALSLSERAARANDAGAALFLSLHASAVANPDVSGTAIYVYDPIASSGNAEWLAERENADATLPGVPMLASRRDTASQITSDAVASALLREFQPSLPLQGATVQRAPLAALRLLSTPCLLIDVGSLSNRSDEQRLRDPAYAQRVSEAVARALGRYPDSVVPGDSASQRQTAMAANR